MLKHRVPRLTVYLALLLTALFSSYILSNKYSKQHSRNTRHLLFHDDNDEKLSMVKLSTNQDLPAKKEIEHQENDDMILSNKKKLWTKNIHLCVMFNLNGMKPDVNAVNILITFYVPFFDHITLIFDGAWTEKPAYIPDNVNLIGCDSRQGWYMQKCVRSCLQEAPSQTTGSLYINDDMFINMIKMADLSLTKMWCAERIAYNYTEILTIDKDKLHSIWGWWGPPNYNELKLQKSIEALPNQWIDKLAKNAGFPDHFLIRANLDIIYVPRYLTFSMVNVLTHIIEVNDLFCANAGPLAIGIVASPDSVIELKTGFLWGRGRTVQKAREISEEAYFIHPIKLSKGSYRALWNELAEKQVQAALNGWGVN